MTTLDPDQISAQYLAGTAPSELARRSRCEIADIEAALDATGTARRKRGGTHGYTSRAEAAAFIAARNARILQLHAAGATTAEIMAAVGLQRAAVCKVLRQAHGQRPVSSDAEIIAARRSGVTVKGIVETLHVSHQRVTRVLAGAGMAWTAPDLDARSAEILRRRRAGEHPKAIAVSLGIGETTVYRALRGQDDLPSIHQGAASRATKAKPAKAPKPKPEPKTKAPKPPKVVAPRTPPVTPTHRTCRLCNTPIRLTNWIDHQEAIHGRAKERRTHDDAPLVLPPRPEPQRAPEPPCDICGAARCLTPLAHGRIARARAQHHYQPGK